MKKCNRKISPAKNGTDRGVCHHAAGHQGRCGNGTCSLCGIKLSRKNSSPTEIKHGRCSSCRTKLRRQQGGFKERNAQESGVFHMFPCGCSGILPTKEANLFAAKASHDTKQYWKCRVSSIITGSVVAANKFGYKSIDVDTPHSVIRKLMEEPNCVLCHEPLKWEFGRGRTPHLHHDHFTGEIIGFTHPICNPLALQNRISELEYENQHLKQELELRPLREAA